MRQFTKYFAAAVAVVGIGLAAQSASAAGPVKVFKTYPPYQTYPVFPRPPIVVAPPIVVRPPIVVAPPIFVPPPRVDFDYVVLYKPSIFSPSVAFGRYETLFGAQNAARQLELSGFATRIERFRDTGVYGW